MQLLQSRHFIWQQQKLNFNRPKINIIFVVGVLIIQICSLNEIVLSASVGAGSTGLFKNRQRGNRQDESKDVSQFPAGPYAKHVCLSKIICDVNAMSPFHPIKKKEPLSNNIQNGHRVGNFGEAEKISKVTSKPDKAKSSLNLPTFAYFRDDYKDKLDADKSSEEEFFGPVEIVDMESASDEADKMSRKMLTKRWRMDKDKPRNRKILARRRTKLRRRFARFWRGSDIYGQANQESRKSIQDRADFISNLLSDAEKKLRQGQGDDKENNKEQYFCFKSKFDACPLTEKEISLIVQSLHRIAGKPPMSASFTWASQSQNHQNRPAPHSEATGGSSLWKQTDSKLIQLKNTYLDSLKHQSSGNNHNSPPQNQNQGDSSQWKLQTWSEVLPIMTSSSEEDNGSGPSHHHGNRPSGPPSFPGGRPQQQRPPPLGVNSHHPPIDFKPSPFRHRPTQQPVKQNSMPPKITHHNVRNVTMSPPPLSSFLLKTGGGSSKRKPRPPPGSQIIGKDGKKNYTILDMLYGTNMKKQPTPLIFPESPQSPVPHSDDDGPRDPEIITSSSEEPEFDFKDPYDVKRKPSGALDTSGKFNGVWMDYGGGGGGGETDKKQDDLTEEIFVDDDTSDGSTTQEVSAEAPEDPPGPESGPPPPNTEPDPPRPPTEKTTTPKPKPLTTSKPDPDSEQDYDGEPDDHKDSGSAETPVKKPTPTAPSTVFSPEKFQQQLASKGSEQLLELFVSLLPKLLQQPASPTTHRPLNPSSKNPLSVEDIFSSAETVGNKKPNNDAVLLDFTDIFGDTSGQLQRPGHPPSLPPPRAPPGKRKKKKPTNPSEPPLDDNDDNDSNGAEEEDEEDDASSGDTSSGEDHGGILDDINSNSVSDSVQDDGGFGGGDGFGGGGGNGYGGGSYDGFNGGNFELHYDGLKMKRPMGTSFIGGLYNNLVSMMFGDGDGNGPNNNILGEAGDLGRARPSDTSVAMSDEIENDSGPAMMSGEEELPGVTRCEYGKNGKKNCVLMSSEIEKLVDQKLKQVLQKKVPEVVPKLVEDVKTVAKGGQKNPGPSKKIPMFPPTRVYEGFASEEMRKEMRQKLKAVADMTLEDDESDEDGLDDRVRARRKKNPLLASSTYFPEDDEASPENDYFMDNMSLINKQGKPQPESQPEAQTSTTKATTKKPETKPPLPAGDKAVDNLTLRNLLNGFGNSVLDKTVQFWGRK